MMVNKQNDGAAFPVDPNVDHENQCGMTLRDYFAAKAMLGILSSSGAAGGWVATDTSQWAYEIADAMLEARTK